MSDFITMEKGQFIEEAMDRFSGSKRRGKLGAVFTELETGKAKVVSTEQVSLGDDKESARVIIIIVIRRPKSTTIIIIW